MNARIVSLLVMVSAVLATAPALAQTKPPGGAAQSAAPPAPSPPAQASLVVGALQLGSAAALEVVGIDINVAADSVVYSYYRLKNDGSVDLHLTAMLALPSLQASTDGK